MTAGHAGTGPGAVEFYRSATAMTALPRHPALAGLPDDLDAVRRVVQGLLLHRDWAPSYGVEGDAVRLDEQNLRSTAEVLGRAFELSDAPVTEPRPPIDRVRCICRHFALLHTAFLRSQGEPATVRCALSTGDDVDAVRARYRDDDRLRVHPDITRFVDGQPVQVRLPV